MSVDGRREGQSVGVMQVSELLTPFDAECCLRQVAEKQRQKRGLRPAQFAQSSRKVNSKQHFSSTQTLKGEWHASGNFCGCD